MAKNTIWYWVAYPCAVEKVKVVRKGLNGREPLGEDPPDPYLVEDEEGEKFIVDKSQLYLSPVSAETASAALAQEYDVDCGEEEEEDGEEEEGEIPEVSEDD